MADGRDFGSDSDTDTDEECYSNGDPSATGKTRRFPQSRLQPYPELLEDESIRTLQEIKFNLSKAVLCQDVKVGARFWVYQLSRYMSVYGYSLEKPDRIALIHLLYEIICLPGLDWSLIIQFAVCFKRLIANIRLIARDALELPWKPLHELYNYVYDNPLTRDRLVLLPYGAERTIKNLVELSRVYFSDSSTQEMLDEWLPKACPFDMAMGDITTKLELFLPTIMEPKSHDKGYKLWLDEIMKMYISARSAPSWRKPLAKLLSRVATSNIGCIDWEPHLALICTRLLNAFEVPVGPPKFRSFGVMPSNTPLGECALWLVAAITKTNTAIDHIERMLTALQPFFHPSNDGRWTKKLTKFLSKLTFAISYRVHSERYKKKTWFLYWDEDNKLTDDQIARLVLIIKPVALTALFNKGGIHEVCLSLQDLTNLRPDLVFPDLMGCLLNAFDSLTEPYRLLATLSAATTTARTLISDASLGPGYRAGRAQVLQILQLTLPGIDPNDFKKTACVCHLVIAYSSLVPFVDCSDALHLRSDLTEEEKELCSLSAQFEDFVLLFLDRVFYLIESSSLSHSATTTKANAEDRYLEAALWLSVKTMLSQCSQSIFKAAFAKVYRFVTTNTFEVVLSGRQAVSVAGAACAVNGEAGGKLLSAALDNILQLTQVDVQDEEQLDTTLLWWIQLLEACMACGGSELVKHKDSLLSVLSRILCLVNSEGGKLVERVLEKCLGYLIAVYPQDFRCSEDGWDLSLTEHLPIRDWGRLYTPGEMTVNWHKPTGEEVAMAEDIVTLVLDTVKTPLTSLPSGSPISRKKLEQVMAILCATICGARTALPVCESNPVPLDGRILTPMELAAGPNPHQVRYRGKCVREESISLLRPLVAYLLNDVGDSARLLQQASKVYTAVLFYHQSKGGVGGTSTEYRGLRLIFGNALSNIKKKPRIMQVDKAQGFHKRRLLHAYPRVYTAFIRDALRDVFTLATSKYSSVQQIASTCLLQGFQIYVGSLGPLVGDITGLLKKDENISEEQLTGALKLIEGQITLCEPCLSTNWSHQRALHLALSQCSHSERPHIQACIGAIMKKIRTMLETIGFSHTVTPSCRDVALRVLRTSGKGDVDPFVLEAALLDKEEREKGWRREYDLFVKSLIQLLSENSLQWKHADYALDLLGFMVRWDVQTERETAKVFVEALISTSYSRRKTAKNIIIAMLCQQKPARVKRSINPRLVTSADLLNSGDSTVKLPSWAASEAVGATKTEQTEGDNSNVDVPGMRANNMWAQYDRDSLPTTAELWEDTVFVEKTFWGFYKWPREMTVYAPPSCQPPYERAIPGCPGEATLGPAEEVIIEAFRDPNYVKQLFSYMSMANPEARPSAEDGTAGRDKFQLQSCTLFKCIIRNFGPSLLPVFMETLEGLAADRTHETHASRHRCMSEVLAGMVRGSKHWPYHEVMRMWEWILPFLKKVLSQAGTDHVSTWGSCFIYFSADRDPRKLYPLLEWLLEGFESFSLSSVSLDVWTRLYYIQAVLSQQEWRVASIQKRLLSALQEGPWLHHPFKLVRSQVSSVLSTNFMGEYNFSILRDRETTSGLPTRVYTGPTKADLVQSLLPHLKLPLKSVTRGDDPLPAEIVTADSSMDVEMLDSADSSISSSSSSSEEFKGRSQDVDVVESDIKMGEPDDEAAMVTAGASSAPLDGGNSTLQYFKTTLVWLYENFWDSHNYHAWTPEILKLFPLVFPLTADQSDPDVRLDTLRVISSLSFSELPGWLLTDWMKTIGGGGDSEDVASLSSWHARSALLEHVQLAVFKNMFVLEKAGLQGPLRDLILRLIEDDKVEVRNLASVTLSGAVQCGFIAMDTELVNHFFRLALTKLSKTRRSQTEDAAGEIAKRILTRHAGVLGMCACVSAYPYTIPEQMPRILMKLSEHIHDPQPIQETVKSSLSEFKRTHLEEWAEHKKAFTDDQLVTLTDLLVSPSYYA